MWSTEKLMDALGLELTIIQAPMAGANGSAIAANLIELDGRDSVLAIVYFAPAST